MNEKMGYRVDSELKSEYDAFITLKYGSKHSKCGSEITKLMKFQLAANGNSKYQKDPEVLAILEKANENFNNKPKTNKNDSLEERIEKKIDEKFDTMKEEIFAQFEKKARRESSKRHGLADFKKQFKMAFHDYNQVSRKDLEHFIMNQVDIVDNRSIKSRIQYLLANEVLEPYAPNIYNVKIG